jgi:hypothetical protein
MRTLMQDVRYGLRMQIRNPLVTVLVVIILAVGSGGLPMGAASPMSFPIPKRVPRRIQLESYSWYPLPTEGHKN